MATFKKGDQETLEFGFDWSDWCTAEGVTISTSTWTVPSGITNVSDASSSTGTTIVLSGGTVGQVYKIVNVITTSGTPIAERSMYILILEDKFK